MTEIVKPTNFTSLYKIKKDIIDEVYNKFIENL